MYGEMWRRRHFHLQSKMKCLTCANRISDWRLLKSLPGGHIECQKCGARHRITERGIGLAWLMPLMGVTAAIVLSVLFMLIEVNAVVQAVILLAVIVAVFKLAITWGVKLSVYSGS